MGRRARRFAERFTWDAAAQGVRRALLDAAGRGTGARVAFETPGNPEHQQG
jgi:hypothetical protein